MKIRKETYNQNIQKKEEEELERERESKRIDAAKKKTDMEERTLATFSWKDHHIKCFFKHFKSHEEKYNKASGKIKR